MASYNIIEPNKKGEPRIKLYAEYGRDEQGKRLRKTKVVTLPSLSETNIINAVAKFEKSLGIETPSFQKPSKITFKDFAEHFMENYVNVELKVQTRNSYENYLQKGLLDFFGNIPLHKITHTQINVFFTQQKKEKAGSIYEKYCLLKCMFNRAIEWGYCETNPVLKATKQSRKNTKAINYYNEQQIKQLLELLPKLHIKHQLQIKIALFCGLRLTEISGLRFECIDFERGTILVNRTLQYDYKTKTIFLSSTKTSEERIVYAPKHLIQELEEYINQKKKKLEKLGERFNPIYENGKPVYLIFSKDNGYPNFPDRMGIQWRDIVAKYKLPKITFHGLRHTYASFMLLQGVNIKVIQEQLGHANIQETLNTYSHIDNEQKEKASDLFRHLIK